MADRYQPGSENLIPLGEQLYKQIMSGEAEMPIDLPASPGLPSPQSMQAPAQKQGSLFQRVRMKGMQAPQSETASGKMPLSSFPMVQRVLESYQPQQPQIYNPLSNPQMGPQQGQAYMVAPNMMRQ